MHRILHDTPVSSDAFIEFTEHRNIVADKIQLLARMSTLQFLQACDELNELHIDVYFEVEKLHINDPQAVRMLTLYASVYQNESETKSYGVRWGHLVRFKNGSSKFYNRPCYGYKQSPNGALEIVPNEAAVVNMIYAWHSDTILCRRLCNAP